MYDRREDDFWARGLDETEGEAGRFSAEFKFWFE